MSETRGEVLESSPGSPIPHEMDETWELLFTNDLLGRAALASLAPHAHVLTIRGQSDHATSRTREALTAALCSPSDPCQRGKLVGRHTRFNGLPTREEE